MGLALCAAPAAAQDEAAKPDRVNSGIQLVTSTDIVAKQRGWAEELLDVPVNWVSFESGRSAILGLAARGIDWVLVGSAPAAFGLSSGVDAEIVWIFNLLGENEALVVRPDRDIESVEDLVGKTIGVPAGTTTHYDLLMALELAGVDQGDVNILDMDPPEMAAAFERGDIDGGWVWFPALQRFYDAGGVSIMNALDLAEAGYPTADVLVIDPEFGANYPDTVARYLAALHCGVVLGNQDLPTIAADMEAEFGLDSESAQTALEQVQRLTAEEHLEERFLGTEANVGSFADAIWSQAHFLMEQGIVETAQDQDFYHGKVNPRYIELAIAQGYTEQCDQLSGWPQ